MDKLKMHSVNKVDENIEKIGKLFPNCVTERKNGDGEVEYAIDFDMLRQELSSVVVEGNEERYQFTWPDKKKSILLANAPIAKTLRPCREESVDFDNTENLYIEGDNLDVLKLLQETYLGKIKMIYIDPPYNTGTDFLYPDDFSITKGEYLQNSGQFSEEGYIMEQNLESNGRFHTDWLNIIFPRLKLAKDLLDEYGVLFVSIDDNEFANLKKLCDEVFGTQNFLGCITWTKKTKPINSGSAKYQLQSRIEYILVYCKSKNAGDTYRFILSSQGERKYNYKTDKGLCRLKDIEDSDHGAKARDTMKFPILGVTPPEGKRWKIGLEEASRLVAADRVKIVDGKVKILVYPEDETSEILEPFWSYLGDKVGTAESGKKELNALMETNIGFDTVKPVDLITELMKHIDNNSIVLDFYSGSATTAQAMMLQNKVDNGSRKFILVQIPEKCEENTDAYRAGYENICEIGKERIRRAGAKIKGESPMTTENLDIGFRVLKLDSSNMKDVYYNPADYEASMFEMLADNIKEDRTPEDLLFQVMLDLGILLSSKIEETEIAGKKVFNVADNFLIACFDENVTDDVIIEIAKKNPYYFVMRDSSMANDSVATNFDQIFATYSPDTVRKVL